jgi:hypothetical protein
MVLSRKLLRLFAAWLAVAGTSSRERGETVTSGKSVVNSEGI